MKDDEVALWAAVVAGEKPREAGLRLGMHPKRVTYLCLKWTAQRKYDYGIAADLGWTLDEDGFPVTRHG